VRACSRKRSSCQKKRADATKRSAPCTRQGNVTFLEVSNIAKSSIHAMGTPTSPFAATAQQCVPRQEVCFLLSNGATQWSKGSHRTGDPICHEPLPRYDCRFYRTGKTSKPLGFVVTLSIRPCHWLASVGLLFRRNMLLHCPLSLSLVVAVLSRLGTAYQPYAYTTSREGITEHTTYPCPTCQVVLASCGSPLCGWLDTFPFAL
jgi:hypothetical protein